MYVFNIEVEVLSTGGSINPVTELCNRRGRERYKAR